MASKEQIQSKTESLLQPIMEINHFELVDVEYLKEGSNWYLRIYIDKEGGITINDCEVVSRAFSELLDEDDYITGAYIMEVSSPGLGRPLKKEKDFARNLNREVEIHLYKAKDKTKEFRGILEDYTDKTVTIKTEEEEEIVFEKKDISLIRLAFDWSV
jgi:ribosome maturation factor RimP